MKKSILFGISFVLLFPGFGQVNLKKLDKYLEQARVDWAVPGMSIAIVKDGQVVHNKGYGLREVGKSAPVDENTLYAIASNTKAFISGSLATLVAEEKISWDDPVTDYLPYFKLYDSYATDQATIRDLLCHRLGLGTFSGDVIWYKSNLSAEEVIKRAKYVPQAYSFRGGWGYSNLMYITAGEVIKSVTGQSWDAYAREKFFAPLKMNRTITSTRLLEGMGNAATPHKPVKDENIPIAWTNWDNMGAAGGIISSTTDMAKWIQFQLNGGNWDGTSIINKDQQNIMWTPHNNFVLTESAKEWAPGRHFNGYGLGWGLFDYHGRMVVSHSGGYDGMYSRVVLVPDENLGFVILTNSMTGISSPLMYQIINAYIKEDMRDWSAQYLDSEGSGGIPAMVKERTEARQSGKVPSAEMSTLSGTYFDPMYGNIIVSEENGQLRLDFEIAPDLSATLEHWHFDTYEIKWDNVHAWFDFGTVQFVQDNNREVTGIEFDVPNYDIFFHEIHAVRVNDK